MTAFSVSAASPRFQNRWDPEYHCVVEENSSAVARMEADFTREEMISLARGMAEILDPQGWKDLQILSRSNDRVDRDRILKGIEEDPSLGLVLVQKAAIDMVSRVEEDLVRHGKTVDDLRYRLAGLAQRPLPIDAPVSPQSRPSSPKP